MNDADLDEELSRPSADDIEALRALPGDVVILGASGKMGPGLARLIRRAADAAGVRCTVTGVARFADSRVRDRLEAAGVRTVAADLLVEGDVAALPDAPHVLYLVGQKFGTRADPPGTWAANVLAASRAAARYAGARFVAFSTGNVYPLTPPDAPPDENHPTGPVGEYAWSALARERVLAFHAERDRTPMTILRLNYAVEPRYGVLRDVADRVRDGVPLDLTMGYVNVIWQRDAASVALRALGACAVPPLVLNVTGPDVVSIRRLAYLFAERFGVEPEFVRTEADTALLSDAARMVERFGPPSTTLEAMVDRVSAWVTAGGRSLDKPTRFEVRDGAF